MSNLNKIIDRVKKLLALADRGTEAEAASAAEQAARLMEQYELDEAVVRLVDTRPAERIVKARLESDKDEVLDAGEDESKTDVGEGKRVAWKEVIAVAVAEDLGVHTYFWKRKLGGRLRRDMRGMGRESAIQAWRYTYQYLCRAVDELATKAWGSKEDDAASIRAWKNAFRVGCASRLAVRIAEARKAIEWDRRERVTDAVMAGDDKPQMAMVVVDRDREEVSQRYDAFKKETRMGTAPSVGGVSSRSGYDAGREAGDKVSLGGGRGGLPAGQPRLRG